MPRRASVRGNQILDQYTRSQIVSHETPSRRTAIPRYVERDLKVELNLILDDLWRDLATGSNTLRIAYPIDATG